MVDAYPGLGWTGPDPHEPHPKVNELLPTISAPTTVVVGELDVPCFREMAEVYAERIPNARWSPFPTRDTWSTWRRRRP